MEVQDLNEELHNTKISKKVSCKERSYQNSWTKLIPNAGGDNYTVLCPGAEWDSA